MCTRFARYFCICAFTTTYSYYIIAHFDWIFTYVYSHNNIFHLCTTFVCQLLQRQQEGQREDHSRDVCLHFYTNILGADRAIYSHNIIYSMIFISKYISKYMFTRFARSILITYVLFYGILGADTCLRASRDLFTYIHNIIR